MGFIVNGQGVKGPANDNEVVDDAIDRWLIRVTFDRPARGE